jgi:hypothetical protein
LTQLHQRSAVQKMPDKHIRFDENKYFFLIFYNK